MLFIANIVVLTTLVWASYAEVKLRKGVNSTVQFTGDELLMRLNNPQKQTGILWLCFQTFPGIVYQRCPYGYTGGAVNVVGTDETCRINRKGELFYSKGEIPMSKVRFEEDGTLNVLVADMPSGATMILPNAEIPIVLTSTTLAPKKQKSNKAVIIIVGIAILFILLAIVGLIAWCFCLCRRKKRQSVPEKEFRQVRKESDRKVDNQPPKTDVKTAVTTLPRNQPPSKTTTMRTSTSTTKASDEKPRVDESLKVAPITSNQSVASKIHCVSIMPASTQTSVYDVKSRTS